ncbi:MAG: hypothetical protein ACJ74M_08055 [Gaiellaceae bacterium]|jgi:hypothetical protein
MECRCDELTEAYGTEAEHYARDHLHSDEVRTDAFDFPERTEREPGQARLQRI